MIDFDKSSKIEIGDSVKVFLDAKEKLWLEVTEVNNSLEKKLFKGKIDVDPYVLDKVKFGDVINFEQENVIDVLKK